VANVKALHYAAIAALALCGLFDACLTLAAMLTMRMY
jgi:hypothetical protein